MPPRAYDLILYGVGFTGRWTAKYLARAAPPTLKWALAARSQAKMQELRDELARETPALASLPLLVANSDEAGAALVASSAAVVISTAGPFALCGSALIGACARAGTHCAFCRRARRLPRALALADGARATEPTPTAPSPRQTRTRRARRFGWRT